MAAVDGCIENRNTISAQKIQEREMREERLLNGQTTHCSNGYVKSSLLPNGVAKIPIDVEPWDGTGEIPRMDWSQYDTWGGSFEGCSILTAALTHLGMYFLMLLGFLNQLVFKPKGAFEKNREGYAPLYNPFEQFFSRYVYRRVRHCFNRPICSTPGATLVLKERVTNDYNWTFSWSGTERECINLGSYNYLGFAEAEGERARAAAAAARQYGLAMCSPRAELGSTPLHEELERTTAQFLGVEAAIVFGMGFATNSLVLPALVGPGALVLSDANNHASLILGLRLARVTVRVFKHNDVRDLERLARAAIRENKWTKIVVVVEGVYSMEGSAAPLRALLALKARLGLQLYLDEAHSVGALGGAGRGVSDLARAPPAAVDVLMGTFTKSFGAAGGYIAGSRALVSWVRAHGHAHSYAHAMSPPVAAQVLAAMRAIAAPEGAARVRQLRENTHYFRERLRALGVVVFGHPDSPVVPLLVYSFSKMAATVERLTARGVATVGVGFPASPLSQARIRFCLSAAHTREQLDTCLDAIQDVVQELGLQYSRRPAHTLKSERTHALTLVDTHTPTDAHMHTDAQTHTRTSTDAQPHTRTPPNGHTHTPTDTQTH